MRKGRWPYSVPDLWRDSRCVRGIKHEPTATEPWTRQQMKDATQVNKSSSRKGVMSGESFCLFSGFASWVGGKVLILKLCAAHTVLWVRNGLDPCDLPSDLQQRLCPQFHQGLSDTQSFNKGNLAVFFGELIKEIVSINQPWVSSDSHECARRWNVLPKRRMFNWGNVTSRSPLVMHASSTRNCRSSTFLSNRDNHQASCQRCFQTSPPLLLPLLLQEKADPPPLLFLQLVEQLHFVSICSLH